MRGTVLPFVLIAALLAAPLTAAEPPCPAAPGPTGHVTKVFAVMDLVVPIPDFVNPAPMKHVDVLTAAPKPQPAQPMVYRLTALEGSNQSLVVNVQHLGLTPPPPVMLMQAGAAIPTPTPAPASMSALAPAPETGLRLRKLILTTCRPQTWAENGGTGTIDFHPVGGAMVVCNAPEVVKEVDSLLGALRKEQDCNVVVECRLITVTPEMVKLFDNPGLDGAGMTCLTAEQAHKFLSAVQSCPQANVMQAPKMTLFNGQTARMFCGDQVSRTFTTGMNIEQQGGQTVTVPKQVTEQFGTDLRVQPTLSADRKYVRLAFALSQKELGGPVELMPVTHTVTPVFEGGAKGQPIPFTQFLQQPAIVNRSVNRAVTLPDGGTVAVRLGTKMVETRSECGPPVLSQVPYLNRLFLNTGIGREPREVVALLTTRVVMTEMECCPPAKLQCAPTAASCEASSCCEAKGKVTELVAAYRKACAAGQSEMALKLAMQALALDPACFSTETKPLPAAPTFNFEVQR